MKISFYPSSHNFWVFSCLPTDISSKPLIIKTIFLHLQMCDIFLWPLTKPHEGIIHMPRIIFSPTLSCTRCLKSSESTFAYYRLCFFSSIIEEKDVFSLVRNISRAENTLNKVWKWCKGCHTQPGIRHS